jgi:uncharacterized protein YkwD
MRRHSIFIILVILTSAVNAQTWTSDQLLKANTAENSTYLTVLEKEAIMYINLARLYPNDFARIELANYNGTKKYGDYLKKSKYKTSLKATLNKMKPVEALLFDNDLYENAKCYAKEMGDKGTEGHTRKICKKENYAECCSYGMETGKDIVMQLLIDHDVAGLGHRKICLDSSYKKIGISVHPHKKWQSCAVLELIW